MGDDAGHGGQDEAQTVEGDAHQEARPQRRRKQNVKYSSEEYDLSNVRTRSRRQIRRAT